VLKFTLFNLRITTNEAIEEEEEEAINPEEIDTNKVQNNERYH
jgi:hypothetical protein